MLWKVNVVLLQNIAEAIKSVASLHISHTLPIHAHIHALCTLPWEKKLLGAISLFMCFGGKSLATLTDVSFAATSYLRLSLQVCFFVLEREWCQLLAHATAPRGSAWVVCTCSTRVPSRSGVTWHALFYNLHARNSYIWEFCERQISPSKLVIPDQSPKCICATTFVPPQKWVRTITLICSLSERFQTISAEA